MNLELKNKPRIFGVKGHEIKDFGKIILDSSEMISFKTKTGKEYDFVAKEWGFYASPSVNSRLINEGFKTALVVNENNQLYIMVVEEDKELEFKDYLKDKQDNRIVCWLNEFFKDDL